jgi:hypothetical protein
MWYCLYCVFTYIYSLLIERDICDCQNISVKCPCVYVYVSSGDLFIYLVRVSSFFSYIFNTNHTYTNFETDLEILHTLPKCSKLNTTNNTRYIRIIKNHQITY